MGRRCRPPSAARRARSSPENSPARSSGRSRPPSIPSGKRCSVSGRSRKCGSTVSAIAGIVVGEVALGDAVVRGRGPCRGSRSRHRGRRPVTVFVLMCPAPRADLIARACRGAAPETAGGGACRPSVHSVKPISATSSGCTQAHPRPTSSSKGERLRAAVSSVSRNDRSGRRRRTRCRPCRRSAASPSS